MLQLRTAELFVVWSLRHARARPWDSCALAEAHLRAFGLAEVERALAGFAALRGALAMHARRRLSLNGCACGAVSADERAVLTLVAAAQADAQAHADALAAWLCRPAGQPPLIEAARAYAAALARRGLLLPLRRPPRPPGRAAPLRGLAAEAAGALV